MDIKKEGKKLSYIISVFVFFYFIPVGTKRFDSAVLEAFHLVKWYAQEHVILCLIPAFFIAGAITIFIKENSVLKYLGPKSNKVVAYAVSSTSGMILSVCSCTILPMFSGIYRMGAGIGPAIAFLYSGPAINILAIILTARVIGIELGIARAVASIFFSILIGLIMHFIFLKEEKNKVTGSENAFSSAGSEEESLSKTGFFFLALIGILVFANWGSPETSHGIWFLIFSYKWIITAAFAVLLGLVLILWFNIKSWKVILTAFIVCISSFIFPDKPTVPFVIAAIGLSIIISFDKQGEGQEWLASTWSFTKQILPLLFIGILIAGFLLGRVNSEGIIPSEWVNSAVGGNSIRANFFASFAGAFMYFATLTEVPILQGLINNGMGKGPALALLLSGPALSLPNMLVINSVLGLKKTTVFVLLVIVFSTISGVIYGTIF